MSVITFDTPHRPHRTINDVGEAFRASVAGFTKGDRVMYRPAWGTGLPVPGTIVGVGVMDYGYAEGQPVYDVELDNPLGLGVSKPDIRWGYADQISPLNAEQRS